MLFGSVSLLHTDILSEQILLSFYSAMLKHFYCVSVSSFTEISSGQNTKLRLVEIVKKTQKVRASPLSEVQPTTHLNFSEVDPACVYQKWHSTDYV